MATWIVHMRIAEKLLEKYKFDKGSFVIGNIAPDSGVPNEDWTSFNPPKEITHFIKEREFEFEKFYLTYITTNPLNSDKLKLSFLFGYYVHLLTDSEWNKMFQEQYLDSPEYAKNLKENPQFVWEIKKDWYGLDYKFVKDNPENIFNDCFMLIKDIPDYLEFFPEGAFIKQVQYIQRFYTEKNNWVNTTFMHFTQEQMNEFINKTSEYIIDILSMRRELVQLVEI